MWKVLLASLLLSATAAAEPALKALDPHVRVVNARGHKALNLKASPTGWRLELRGEDDGVAEVFDVTPGSPARTVTLALRRGLVTFDRARFAGGHVYRVALRGDAATLGVGFVYLYPEAPAKMAAPERPRVQRLGFDASDAKGGDAEDEMPAVADKGHL